MIDRDASDWRLITVDGWQGSGKTRLGVEMSTSTPAWALDLDAFIADRSGPFVESLELPSLGAAIAAAERRVILFGVCIEAVLARLQLTPNRRIYAKRMHLGEWANEGEALGDEIEEMIRQTGLRPGPLAFEVRAYHRQWQPHLRADYEYHWEG